MDQVVKYWKQNDQPPLAPTPVIDCYGAKKRFDGVLKKSCELQSQCVWKKRISAAKTCRDCSVSPVASASADSLCLIGCSWCPCCFWSYLLCCLLATLPGVCPASFCVSYFTISFNININFIILSASVAGLSSWFCSSFQIISVSKFWFESFWFSFLTFFFLWLPVQPVNIQVMDSLFCPPVTHYKNRKNVIWLHTGYIRYLFYYTILSYSDSDAERFFHPHHIQEILKRKLFKYILNSFKVLGGKGAISSVDSIKDRCNYHDVTHWFVKC